MKVNVMSGDITQTTETVDAITTLVNSIHLWFGGVDRAIQKKCGNRYHSQLSTKINHPEDGIEAFDGRVYIVEGEKKKNSFKDVIFVIDDLTLPLSTLVFNALEAAEKANYKRIAMPAMRTGVMSCVIEKNILETVSAMKQGFFSLKEKYPVSALTVDIVIYDDTSLEKLIKDNIGC